MSDKYILSRVELIDLTYNKDTNNFDIPKVNEFLKGKQQVEGILTIGLQGDTITDEVKLYISKDDYMKDLNFRKIYVERVSK